jgi:hypothetical protein
VSSLAIETTKQSTGKTLAQFWGIAVLGFLFGMGGYRLLMKAYSLYTSHPPLDLGDYALYALLLVFGVGKAEMLFRRKFIPRTLARARDAIGETGWAGDYPLAPFLMLSLYRPWQKKHAIMSWVLIPIMVGLAVLFAIEQGVPDGTFKGAVDLAIGLALAFAALVFLVYLLRLLAWWMGGAKAESNPLPASEPFRKGRVVIHEGGAA